MDFLRNLVSVTTKHVLSDVKYLDSSNASFCSYDSLSLLSEGGIGLLAPTGFKFRLFMLPLELNRISVVEKSLSPLFAGFYAMTHDVKMNEDFYLRN